MDENEKITAATMNKHVHIRLRTRLWLYFAISFLMIGFVSYHVVVNRVSVFFAFIALFIGLAAGIFISRLLHISWDHKGSQVISRLDIYGVILIALSILIEIFKENIVGYFVHDQSVVALSFALIAGTMIGRFLGIRGKVREVLRGNL